MKYSLLVLDISSLNMLSSSVVEDSWFENFIIPSSKKDLKRVVVGDVIYIISKNSDIDSKFLVINLEIFSDSEDKNSGFDRLVTVALSELGTNIRINAKWGAFKEGHFISIYSMTAAKGQGSRYYFNTFPDEYDNVIYAYSKLDQMSKFSQTDLKIKKFRNFTNSLLDALEAPSLENTDVLDENTGIVLLSPSSFMHFGNETLQEWLQNKLTGEQLAFVNRPLDAPVRLKGPAGSGKTVALAIKCLNDFFKKIDEGIYPKFAFITHSQELARHVVTDMFSVLDPSDNWKDISKGELWIGSLYELAQEKLGYQNKAIVPLSLDGREGMSLQIDFIKEAIRYLKKDLRFKTSILPKCSKYFSDRFKSENIDDFVIDISNEFSSTIDADRIKKGTPEAESYVNGRRYNYQMMLDKIEDRRAVLEIHAKYTDLLRDMNTLSMDQMIADFNNHIRSNEWQFSQKYSREDPRSEGFDAIYVDEFHYFNSSERMSFRPLFQPEAFNNDKPPLFMAYDFKQSTRDLNIANFFKKVEIGETQGLELTKVFRSTPEIAAFLQDLDSAFPPLDLAEEWGGYSGSAQTETGATPELRCYGSQIQLVDETFRQALHAANLIGGRNVAVLCLNPELFDTYIRAGRTQDKYAPVTGRDEFIAIKSNIKKPVFSMPEYVAGLQFDSVFIMHVDQLDLSDDELINRQRRFISSTYLGASRASKKLVLSCCYDRGGPSRILNSALANGTLVRTEFDI
ncbi:hypothetical protein SAMN04488056_1302 [Cohaesibacter marisflavi]|uniref:DNA 3'-5' helicase II n=1 Tax=Cohaesibacter marisflavi TaxID=655353 RepID=A0A1I5NG62_9HYPH|nr:hypothetical protein [Cohaesibacter marisflavi]SFP20336.1 hypothetical protein SAMN04488056_1302 [Cohaesibacter marisflavi]